MYTESSITRPLALGTYVRPAISKSHQNQETQDFSPSPANVVAVYNFRWTMLCAQASHCEAAEAYVDAKEYWLRALSVTDEFSFRDSRVAQTLRNLANLHYRLGEYQDAEDYAIREAEVIHRNFGSNHLGSAASLNLLGSIYFAQGSLAAAELCFYQVLRVTTLFYGLEDRRTALAAQSLGIVLNKQGKRELGVKYLLQALQADKRADGAQNGFKAMIVAQIADLE